MTVTRTATPSPTGTPFQPGENAMIFATGGSASTTRYFTWSAYAPSGSRYWTAPSAGRLRNFYVTCKSLPLSSQTFTLQVQGVDTLVGCTRSALAMSCSDTTDIVNFSAGQQIGVRVDPPNNEVCKISLRVTELDDTAHNSIVYWNGTGVKSPGTNSFCGPSRSGVDCTASAVDASFIMPAAATLKRIAVHTSANLNAGETHTYSVRNVTTGLSAAPTVTSSLAGSVSGVCTTNCAFNAGDLVAVNLTVSGTETAVIRWITLEFDGIGTIALVGAQRSTNTRYGMWGNSWLSTSQGDTVYQSPSAATFRRLYAHSTSGADRSLVRVCVGASNPPPCTNVLACNLAPAADGARCNDQSDAIKVNAGDYFQIQFGPQANAGGSVRASFEIAPASP